MRKEVINTTLVTGATSGIGRAATFELAHMGYQLILLSRNLERLEKTKSEIITQTNNKNICVVACDLASQKDIRKAVVKIRCDFPTIDVLINNAGINTSKYELTEDGVEKTFAVNHYAYFLLTGLLLDNLKKSKQGRIINVSSNGHNKVNFDIEKLRNNQYQGMYATYRRSKLANVMFTIDLASRLKDTNVTVNCLHPGLIRTNIGKNDRSLVRKTVNFLKIFIAQPPDKGAETVVYLATSNEVASITGKYFINKRVARHSKVADNTSLRKQLWQLSEKVTGLHYS